MSFQSTNRAYTDRALKHFKSFIEEHRLFSPNQKLLLAVSGGIDSMLLGHFVYLLRKFGYSNKLRFIYVNHNTRPGQLKERELVEAFAHHLKVEFVLKVLKDLNPERNFEHEARMQRYKVMKDELEEGEVLLFAHHIDDSYEWSILQGLRSSNLTSMLGIPLVNGKIRRPLMCFTKKQIKRIATYFDLPFIQDPTNELIKYERNFLRHRIITSLGTRHPKYLQHYVNRHNELARKLGVHRSLAKESSFHYRSLDNAVEIYSLKEQAEKSGVEELVLKAVQEVNPGVRGSLHGQIKKIKEAMGNNKYGPLALSGGVKVYLDFNYLLVANSNYELARSSDTEAMSFTLEEYKTFLHQNPLPLFVVLDSKQKGFVFSKRVHPLWRGLTDQNSLEKMRYLSPIQLLRQWSKAKNKNKSLNLTFFVTP